LALTLHKIRFALHGAPTSKGREGPPYSFTLNVSVAIVLCLSLEFVDARDSEWEDIEYNMEEIDSMIANAYPQTHGTKFCVCYLLVDMVPVCTTPWVGNEKALCLSV